MPNNTTTISSFGQTPGLASLFLVVAAALLTILAGLFLVAGALLGFIAREHTARMPYAMFTVAVVLLVLIVALLLVLLWIVLRGDTKFPVELLTVLPVLAQLPGALKASATALKAGAAGLDLLQNDIRRSGQLLVDFAHNAPDDFKVPVPHFGIEPVPHTPWFYLKDVNLDNKVDLTNLKVKLEEFGNAIKANADSIEQKETDLANGAVALEALATALGSPP